MTDLRELKALLEISSSDSSEDIKLNFLVEQASNWIEEFLGRGNLGYAARTEFYKGSGSQKLLLRHRPVYTSPTIQVWVDEAAFYGAVSGSFGSTTTLTWGDDFTLQIDQPDGSSRSGVLIRPETFWPRPQVRQGGYLSPHFGEGFGNVKVTYTAGYTVENLPSVLRLACNILVAHLRYLFPLGMFLASESYEERSISFMQRRRSLMSMVEPMLTGFRNWKF